MNTGPAAPKNKPANGDGIGIGALALILFFLYGLFWALPVEIWGLIPARLKYPVVYSISYHIPMSRVQVVDQPSDCEWGHAPLGDKSCSYEKKLIVSRGVKGQVVEVTVSWYRVQSSGR